MSRVGGDCRLATYNIIYKSFAAKGLNPFLAAIQLPCGGIGLDTLRFDRSFNVGSNPTRVALNFVLEQRLDNPLV